PAAEALSRSVPGRNRMFRAVTETSFPARWLSLPAYRLERRPANPNVRRARSWHRDKLASSRVSRTSNGRQVIAPGPLRNRGDRLLAPPRPKGARIQNQGSPQKLGLDIRCRSVHQRTPSTPV